MAKKKKAPAVPAIYEGLTITKLMLDSGKFDTDLCVVIDKHGDPFKFDTSSNITIVKDAIMHQWGRFNDFDDWAGRTHADFARLHEQLFRAPLAVDPIEGRVYVWKKLLTIAKDRTTAGNPINQGKVVNADGKLVRKSHMGERLYFLGVDGRDASKILLIKTPQARSCLKILTETLDKVAEAMKAKAKPDEVVVPSITEEDFCKIIIARSAELKTRQDPWRIFQYYRPTLLAAKMIRHD